MGILMLFHVRIPRVCCPHQIYHIDWCNIMFVGERVISGLSRQVCQPSSFWHYSEWRLLLALNKFASLHHFDTTLSGGFYWHSTSLPAFIIRTLLWVEVSTGTQQVCQPSSFWHYYEWRLLLALNKFASLYHVDSTLSGGFYWHSTSLPAFIILTLLWVEASTGTQQVCQPSSFWHYSEWWLLLALYKFAMPAFTVAATNTQQISHFSSFIR